MKLKTLFLILCVAPTLIGCSNAAEKIAKDVPAVEEAAYKEVTATEAQAAVEKPSVQFIDVRGEGEFAVRHAPSSRNIPLADLEARISELNPTAPTIVICEVGQRSKVAATRLKKAGFTDVSHVTGGIQEWVKAGLPVEGESGSKK